jgi:hypothetical protein
MSTKYSSLTCHGNNESGFPNVVIEKRKDVGDFPEKIGFLTGTQHRSKHLYLEVIADKFYMEFLLLEILS